MKRKKLTLDDAIKAIKYENDNCIIQTSRPLRKIESDIDKLGREAERILNNYMR